MASAFIVVFNQSQISSEAHWLVKQVKKIMHIVPMVLVLINKMDCASEALVKDLVQ
jgi:hypothetical protein